MEKVIQLISIVFLVSGICCYVMAYRRRSPIHPGLNSSSSFKPQNWLPLWKTKDWYDHKGYQLQTVATVLIISGALLSFFS